MAASSWVIRLEADKGKTPILIKVSRKEGGHDLDLDLLATDGDAAYAGKGRYFRQRSLTKLRAKNYDGSDDDWAATISYILRPRAGRPINPAQKRNVDVTCSISGSDPNGTLSIGLCHNVEDITQKLGSIELLQIQDTDDIDLFGWTLQVIEKRDELDQAIDAQIEELNAKDNALQTLQKQIDELVEAKAEHEAQLLSKFTVLLNEKKLKIRNMQRVMSTAKTDSKKLRELRSVVKNDGPTSTGRRNKRRAEPRDDETDGSDAFEAMDVDTVSNVQQRVPRGADSVTSRETTPTHSDTTEDEEDELVAPESTAQLTRRTVSNSKENSQRKSPDSLPPRRELPFEKKSGRVQGEGSITKTSQKLQSTALSAEDDEETASEDDEL